MSAKNWACLEHDTLDRLSTIKLPVLIMGGAQDPICSPTCTSWMSERLSNSRTVMFDGCSHFFAYGRTRQVHGSTRGLAFSPLKIAAARNSGMTAVLFDLNSHRQAGLLPAEKPAFPFLIAVMCLSRILTAMQAIPSLDRHCCSGPEHESADVQSGDTRAIDLVGVLEEQIALGQVAPCARLVEEEIAKRYQVKRYTVRQALSDLETMGVVVIHPNRGASVRDYTVQEVEQLYVVRTLIEQHAAELMPLPADRKVIGVLRKIHARHSAAVEKGDLKTAFRENLLFPQDFLCAMRKCAFA